MSLILVVLVFSPLFPCGAQETVTGIVEIPEAKCPTCFCGITVTDSGWKIVGGWPARPREYPWMVAIVYRRSNRLFCGGTLIADIYVLTAAHCVRQMRPEQLEIVISDGDHVDMALGMSERRRVVRVKAHRDFNIPRSNNNDIALLKMDKPVHFGIHRSPACLPPIGESYAGELGRVIGWGKTSESGNRSTWLLEASVPILSQRTCSSLSGFMTITDGMMCAAPLDGGVDSCQGDSGGPLLVKEDNEKISIVGIVSWGIGCGRPNNPGIYTRVNRYIPWIIQNTRDGCYCF